MARGRSRSATPPDVANSQRDPLAELLRAMDDPFIQAELVRQRNYFNTQAARDWAEYTQSLNEVDDRRVFHPEPMRNAVTVGGWPARVVVHKRPIIARANTLWSARGLPVGLQVPVGLQWESPFKVVTCIRRKVRRAVIFARRKAGMGAKAKRRRRNERSNIGC